MMFYNFFNLNFFLLFMYLWMFYIMLNYSWSGMFFIFDSFSMLLLCLMSLFILSIVIMSELNFVMLILSQMLVLICIMFFFSGTLISLYIYFEISLFPIILMILGYGSQIEKINSSYYLMFYAAFCSFPFLMVYFYYNLNYSLVYIDNFISYELVFILTLGFMMKFPVYFLHLWLPKAHVEAPTSASMLLAGLLLKLGTLGFFRIMRSLSFIHLNFWFFISFLGMILGSFSCAFQSDSKSLAAYSSITHMGFVLLCLILLSMQSKSSSLMLMLAHGYTSTLMFYFIGEFYHFSSTRMMYYFNSFLNISMFITILFCLVFLSNAGVPPSLSFLSEFISISLSLLYFNFSLLILFLYFFFAFYYSIFFIVNFFMGKYYINLNFFNSSYSLHLLIMMFNIFWLSIFF